MKVMDLAGTKVKHGHFSAGVLHSGNAVLVIRLPDPKVMRIVSRSVFLAMVILTLPFILGPILRGGGVSDVGNGSPSEVYDFEQLGLLFNDLASEGLRSKGDKSLIVSPGNANVGMVHEVASVNVDGNVFDIAEDSDWDRTSSFKDESLDFVFAFDLVNGKFVDRVLKIGGIVALPLRNDPSDDFRSRGNYKIVYLRRYTTTFVAMRKTRQADELSVRPQGRRLCQFVSETRNAVLKGLEGVLLEPPRHGLAKSSAYLKKIKFLPQLLGNSLENYKRRVFVNVGFGEVDSGMVEWFHQNYPKMNTEFEVHNIEVEAHEEASGTRPPNDVADWLKENVKQEDYVVMKAEAEVVVDMIKKSTIYLVDELFLECNNEWWPNREKDKNKRAYWECIALYGRLKDLGVAVHQWFL